MDMVTRELMMDDCRGEALVRDVEEAALALVVITGSLPLVLDVLLLWLTLVLEVVVVEGEIAVAIVAVVT